MPAHLLFPLLSSVLFVLGVMFAKQAIGAGVRPWTNTFLSNVGLSLCWLLVALFQRDFLDPGLWGQAALVGLTFVLGQLLTYLAFQKGDVSVATPVFGVKIIMVAMALSWLADESVSRSVWLAASLATVGVGIVQAGSGRMAVRDKTSSRRSLWSVAFALMASFSLTLFDIGLQTWGRRSGASTFLPAMFISVGIWSCGFIPWIDRPHSMNRRAVRPLIGGAVLMAIQAMSMSYSLSRYGDAARINIVYALRGLWAVILSWLLANRFDGAEARHPVMIMMLRLAGAILLLVSVLIAIEF